MQNRPPEGVRAGEDVVRAAYDRMPYPSSAHPRSHPDRLATLATLYGMDPPAIAGCRVLELGCSDGGNLIPMAAEFPDARFLGIDLSPRQIESGIQRREILRLSNLELRAMSLLDLESAQEPFDYIIAHGLFSWVPPEVQERIFEICRRDLSPNGVAYVSYNALPGWHLRQLVRDTMRYHTRGIEDPVERVAKSFEFIELLADTVRGENDPHALFLAWTREHLGGFLDRPTYLEHEYLEEHNTPLYFEDFVARAEKHGLGYLADAEPELNEASTLPARVAEYLQRHAGNRIELEQYMDFARNRPFRWTLLCHAAVAPDRTLVAERMERFHASSAVRPGGSAGEFTRPDGGSLSTRDAPTRALLALLAEAWPGALAFESLRAAIGSRLDGPEGSIDAARLADMLYSLYFSGVLDLRLTPPRLRVDVSAAPRASAHARLQAREGPIVTTQHHQPAKLDDEVARFLLAHLDGSRDLEGLIGLLEREVGEGRLKMQLEGRPLESSPRLREVLDEVVRQRLQRLARLGLLAG